MYKDILSEQAQLFHVFAHPQRLEIIALVADRRLSVSEIYTMLNMPQSVSSQHLRALKQAGVVTAHKEGKHVFYQLASSQFLELYTLARSLVVAHRRLVHGNTKDQVYTDPVCGMQVSMEQVNFSQSYNNQEYYFCASGCLQKFIERPSQYVAKT